jgi:hypothetical protein
MQILKYRNAKFHIVEFLHCNIVELRQHKQIHVSTIYIFYHLLRPYIVGHNHYLQRTYTKIHLRPTAIMSFTIHIPVNSAGLG